MLGVTEVDVERAGSGVKGGGQPAHGQSLQAFGAEQVHRGGDDHLSAQWRFGRPGASTDRWGGSGAHGLQNIRTCSLRTDSCQTRSPHRRPACPTAPGLGGPGCLASRRPAFRDRRRLRLRTRPTAAEAACRSWSVLKEPAAMGQPGPKWRRRWDLNPRWVAPHTISNRADSAALALLRESKPRQAHRSPTGPFRRRRRGRPGWALAWAGVAPALGAAAGSCATSACEPSQGRKAAALSGFGRVP